MISSAGIDVKTIWKQERPVRGVSTAAYAAYGLSWGEEGYQSARWEVTQSQAGGSLSWTPPPGRIIDVTGVPPR